MPNIISDRQRAFLLRLVTERDFTALPEALYTAAATVVAGNAISGRDASEVIGALLRLPKVDADNDTAQGEIPAEAGFYLHNNDVFRVRVSKSSGKPYAEKMEIAGKRGKWTYIRGLIMQIRGAAILTVEEAARLGHHYGVCVICGRALSDPESVARGIGPICAKRVAARDTSDVKA